jgi:hypothetical protein
LPCFIIVGINDKAIYHYQFNLQEETSSSARFSKLATTYKNSATFRQVISCQLTPPSYTGVTWIIHAFVVQWNWSLHLSFKWSWPWWIHIMADWLCT